jgi:hypothetical protein
VHKVEYRVIHWIVIFQPGMDLTINKNFKLLNAKVYLGHTIWGGPVVLD